MKNNTLALRLTDSTRADLESIAADLGVNVSTLVRWMALYCLRLNHEATSYEPKADFLAFAHRQKSLTLF